MHEKLRQEKENVDWNDTESVIDFYESNLLYFDNFNLHKGSHLIEEIAEIKISYILALDIKKHYSKADKCLKHVDILIQKLKGTDLFDNVNELYLYASGIIAQRLKRYEESKDCFNQLLKIDPDNDIYKDWYSASKEWLLYKKSKFVGYFGLALYVLNMIAYRKFHYNQVFERNVEIVAIILMAVGFFAPQIKRFIKKIKKRNQ